jgi:pimeloyl-ACP methyl ester carboxylesterase
MPLTRTGETHYEIEGQEHFPTKWLAGSSEKMRQAKNPLHFPTKWLAGSSEKMRPRRDLERLSDSLGSASALGSPLVLVHGLGMRREMWRPLLPALSRQHRVLAYDLAGHALSRPPADPVTLASFSEQLIRLLDELGIARAPLAGFSLGGMIVRRAAIDHPDRVAALIVLNSAHGRTEDEKAAILKRVAQAAAEGPQATVDAAIERWFTPAYRDAHPEAMAEIRACILANDRTVYPKVYRVLAEGDAEIATAIERLDMPFLAMSCEGDHGNSPDMARRMAALVPGAEVEIVPGLRHMGIWEQPDVFTSAMLDFLERRARR